MAKRYICSDGDTIDAVVWAEYGRRDSAALAAVLQANKGLSAAAHLTAGQLLVLPDIEQQPPTDQRVQLWS